MQSQDTQIFVQFEILFGHSRVICIRAALYILLLLALILTPSMSQGDMANIRKNDDEKIDAFGVRKTGENQLCRSESWSYQEENKLVELRLKGLSWIAISRQLPRWTWYDCRAHYKSINISDCEEKKDRFARIYERWAVKFNNEGFSLTNPSQTEIRNVVQNSSRDEDAIESCRELSLAIRKPGDLPSGRFFDAQSEEPTFEACKKSYSETSSTSGTANGYRNSKNSAPLLPRVFF